MKPKKVIQLTAVLMALVFAAVQTSQAVSLDQSQESHNNNDIRVDVDRGLGQVFTTGTSGYIKQVDILLDDLGVGESFASITLSITTVSSDLPTATVLWTDNFSALSLVAGWNPFNTTVNAPYLNNSTKYAIVMTTLDNSSTSPNTRWKIDRDNNLYVSGTNRGSFVEFRGGVWQPLTISTPNPTVYPNADGAFRTYMDSVPEPGITVLLGISATLILFRRRRNIH